MAEQIYEKHEVLYHYTDSDGLKGILESQCLHAFHFESLNDSTEVKHLCGPLADRLVPSIEKFLQGESKASFAAKRRLQRYGGTRITARQEADGYVENFRKVTFEGGKGGIPFCAPFITSFCSHIGDDDYARNNGLLSQWRAYAEGGYALVFDTKRLCELRNREDEEHEYCPIAIGDVVYEGDDEAFDEEFGALIAKLEELYLLLSGTPDDGKMGEAYSHLATSFTRFKHRGFREEREVRIVAAPETAGLRDHIKQSEPSYSGKPLKPIMARGSGIVGRRYIELFDFKKDHPGLPIVKIIVGPHRQQAEHEAEARKLTAGSGIEITCSETPYIGQR